MTMWIIIILCGAITFLIRFIPLSGLLPNQLPTSINKSLKYIPIVILIPMIINSLSIVEGTEVYLFNNYKLYAALIAVIATIFFKNVFATIMIGMFSFIFMSNFL